MLLSLVLAVAAASAPSGPAVTCVKTTLKANGHTSESSIAEPSGSVEADRYALKIVRMFNVQRERGAKYVPETGYILVETYPNGAFGMSILDMRGKVLPSCARPEQPGGT
jgi:hypothetical protein